MSENQIWSRKRLNQMLNQSFIGTIADNSVEIFWILCFSLLADKGLVERITTLFGLNDLFWVILSSTYYTTRTSMMSRLPKLVQENGSGELSKQFKNHVYLFYAMLIPAGVGSFIFLEKLLLILGVPLSELSFYIPYFQMTIISILIAAPWTTMIPAYLRCVGDTKTAAILDHSVAWSMVIGIFITTHLLGYGVLVAMIVNICANSIPLIWFLYKNPIPDFWKSGLEFSFKDIKESWKIVKWELVRRLSPRISNMIGASFMMFVNPIYLGIRYWVSNLAMYVEGWVDASAGLLNVNVSRNVGIKNTTNNTLVPYKDNEYVFRKSVIGSVLTIILIYIAVQFFTFLPKSIYDGLVNPVIYILLVIEVIAKLRYYMWLSISRSYLTHLNGTAQLIYAVTTALLTPTLMWLFLFPLNLGFIGIFLVSMIVAVMQCLLTEIYFRKKLAE